LFWGALQWLSAPSIFLIYKLLKFNRAFYSPNFVNAIFVLVTMYFPVYLG